MPVDNTGVHVLTVPNHLLLGGVSFQTGHHKRLVNNRTDGVPGRGHQQFQQHGSHRRAFGEYFRKGPGSVYPMGDVDFYSFNAIAGDRVYAATMTLGSASGSTDSQLRLIGSDGTTVIEFDEDDGSLGGLSSSIAGAVIPTTGTYYLQVSHFSATATLRPYDLYLKVQRGSPTPEVEGNDTPATANDTPANGWISGSRDPGVATEQDWFTISLTAGDCFSESGSGSRTGWDYLEWSAGICPVWRCSNQILVVDDAIRNCPQSLRRPSFSPLKRLAPITCLSIPLTRQPVGQRLLITCRSLNSQPLRAIPPTLRRMCPNPLARVPVVSIQPSPFRTRNELRTWPFVSRSIMP